MTVCTQHFQVSRVGTPILYAPAPRPCAAIRANLRLRSNVVQFKDADVVDAARDALPAKIRNQIALDRPVAFLSPSIGRDAPTVNAAIAVGARRAAVKAFAGSPSTLRVAFPRAICGTFKSIARRLNIERAVACHASARVPRWLAIGRQTTKPLIPSWRLRFASAILRTELSFSAAFEFGSARSAVVMDRFHGAILTLRNATAINFDIACDRIAKAYAQPDMFVERAPEPIQQPLFNPEAA